MPNRYCRDELINIALSMAQLPNLQVHDCPSGIVQPDAFSIQWLQDILDFWFHMIPFSATVTSVSLPILANNHIISVPDDFILDVRNGYLVQTVGNDTLSYRRTFRISLQKWLNRHLSNQRSTGVAYPYFYTIVGKDAFGKQTIQVTPTPNSNVNAILWYYQLPPALHADSKPTFPNDYVCVEYIRIRALEWSRIYEPGTAQKFCEKIVAGMKATGLMNEPEDDEIPFDTLTFNSRGGGVYSNSYAWMGDR